MFPDLIVFNCRERRRYSGEFQHQVIIANYREIRVPDNICFCSKLKVLGLSYCSSFSLPWSKDMSLVFLSNGKLYRIFENLTFCAISH